MSSNKTVTMPLELAETLAGGATSAGGFFSAMKELRALLAASQCSEVNPQCSEQLRTQAASAVERQDVQVATMPVERCYDVRAKMIIAFNESRKAGGDLDDGLDAAYKAALRYSPNPLLASPPAPVAVALPEWGGAGDFHFSTPVMTRDSVVAAIIAAGGKVKELNQ